MHPQDFLGPVFSRPMTLCLGLTNARSGGPGRAALLRTAMHRLTFYGYELDSHSDSPMIVIGYELDSPSVNAILLWQVWGPDRKAGWA